MKIPAVRLSVRAGLVEIPIHGVALQKYGLTNVDLPSWKQGDTHGKSEMMIFSKSQMKPSTNLYSQLNIPRKLSFRYDKWLSLRNEYDLPFEMRICTCVIKAIRLSASCHSHSWMTSCRKPNKTSTNFRKQVPGLSFWDDKCLSLRNDLWLSFREPSRFYRTKSDRNGSETRSESRD